MTAMSQPTNSNGQYVRRVVLPSGRAIEVVYFEPLAAEAAGAAAAPPRPAVEDLHVCPECDRDLVYPVEWEEASADALGGRCCAARTASGTTSASSTRPPSTASTRSSTAAPRRSSRDLKRLDAGQHGGRDRALRRRARRRRDPARWTSRLA